MKFKIGDWVMPYDEFTNDWKLDQQQIGQITNIVAPRADDKNWYGYLVHMANSEEYRFYREDQLSNVTLASRIIWNPKLGFEWLVKWGIKNCQSVPSYQLNDFIMDRLFQPYNEEFRKPVEYEKFMQNRESQSHMKKY